MTEIFCKEPIIAAYEGRREYNDINGANAFFDRYHDLAYHVTEGYRIILETENFYISLDIQGATKFSKTCSIEEFKQPGEWIDPFVHIWEEDESLCINYESTLFVGEYLLNVENTDQYYLLRFNDFELKIVPHQLSEDDFPSLRNENHWSYNHVFGLERHIKAKCLCGGKGELLLDFVADYVVRCKECKKSTWAQMFACEAIEEWNNGEIQCDLSDITIE